MSKSEVPLQRQEKNPYSTDFIIEQKPEIIGQRRNLNDQQINTLFKQCKASKFDLEIFRNSPLFKNIIFQELFHKLEKWNQTVKIQKSQDQAQFQLSRQLKQVYQQIYVQLVKLKNQPEQRVQKQINKFVHLAPINKVFKCKSLQYIKMPKAKPSERTKSMQKHYLQRVNFYKSAAKSTKCILDCENRGEVRESYLKRKSYLQEIKNLKNLIEQRQLKVALQKLAKDRARIVSQRIKQRKNQPINSLTLKHGLSKYNVRNTYQYDQVQQKSDRAATKVEKQDLQKLLQFDLLNIEDRKKLKQSEQSESRSMKKSVLKKSKQKKQVLKKQTKNRTKSKSNTKIRSKNSLKGNEVT